MINAVKMDCKDRKHRGRCPNTGGLLSRPREGLRLLLTWFVCLLFFALSGTGVAATVVNGDFSIADPSDQNFGWTLRGAAFIEDGKLKLQEGGENWAEASQTILIPAGAATLSFSLAALHLEANQGSFVDAFEVYLENPVTGASLIEPISLAGSTAIFNVQQTGEVHYAPKVSVPGAASSGSIWNRPSPPVQVTVDLNEMTGTAVPAKIVLLLLGSGEALSRVEIDHVQTMAVPVAYDDTAILDEDTSVLINVLANDTDLDGNDTLDPATVTVVTAPTHGTATPQADGRILYTPVLNYWGADGFTYTVKDEEGNLSNIAAVTISVTPVDDSFSDGNETVTTAEDTPLTGSVLTGTSSVDGPVTVKSFTVAGDATVYTAGQTATMAGKGTLTIGSDGVYTFTPALNYNGAVPVVTYTVTDGSGADDTSTLTISVTPVDDSFSDGNETVTTAEDTPLTGSVLTGTSSVDGPVTVKSFTVAGDATVYTAGQTATMSGKGTLSISGNGVYTFTPALNYYGAVPVVTYAMTDGSGPDVTSTLTISVTPVNDPPVADAGPDQTVKEGDVVTLDGAASRDVEVGALTYAWTQTGGSTVTLSNAGAISPTFTAPSVGADGALLTFQLRVTDAGGLSHVDSVNITVLNVVIPCDVDDNNVIDLSDAVLLLRILARLDTSGSTVTLWADVDGDGQLGGAELICVLQTVAGVR